MQAFDPVFDRRALSGEREPDESVSARAVEIETGRRGDSGLVQHFTRKRRAVVGEAPDIRIDIKRAVDRQQFIEAELR